MAVLMSLGGNSSGDGFLLAPGGATYPAELALSTDAGTASVTLQASPNPANLVFSQTAVNISTTPTVVTVFAMAQSASRGDTTIQVLDGAAVVASFAVTSIKHPVVNFKDRFEARFATDTGSYNRNPIYSATLDTVVPPGWTWGLEGEPDFVPAVGNVPENLETPGMGRVVRYNNPVALRSQAPPVVSTVNSISGKTSSGTEIFTAGDPLIGQPVDLGPDTYLASNWRFQAGDPAPEEYVDTDFFPPTERMALFELHLGTHFSGSSQVGPFTHKATMSGEQTRTPDSRPISGGLVGASADLIDFGLPAETALNVSVTTFSMNRVDALVAEFTALPAGDTPERRNLARRIGHLVGHLISSNSTVAGQNKGNQVMNMNPAFAPRQRTLAGGWANKEVYTGYVDKDLVFNPAGSSVVTYMSEFSLFKFESHMLGFHSDELCGYHKGSLAPHRLVNGGYVGDPHVHTVDGQHYDFQGVGEFTLLRDGDEMEVQVRQWPVAAQNPVTDAYSGLTVCVSVTVAVAARLGRHRISLQPGPERERLRFYVDGKPAPLPFEGIDLDGHSVTAFDAAGETGLRVDYDNQTVLIVTPRFWNSHNIWYMDVSVAHTDADEGIMGIIPQDSWLPRLRDGSTVGPMPADLHDRYVALYQTFADAWRVTDATSLFVYEPGTSTKTFTDPDWPAEQPPCTLKPEFEIPGAPVLEGMPVEKAEQICRAVTIDELRRDCVFDVATTGDETFARSSLVVQDLRLFATTVQIVVNEPPTQPSRAEDLTPEELRKRPDESAVVTATVVPLDPGRPTPTGSVTFVIDGVPMNRPTPLDAQGRARITVARLEPSAQSLRGRRGRRRRVTATYSGGGRYDYQSSSSSSVSYTEAPRAAGKARRS